MDAVADVGEVADAGFFVGDTHEIGELVLPVAKLPGVFCVLVDAAGDGVAVDLVVLVVGEVPVDRGFLGGQLFLDVGQVVLVSGAGLLLLLAGGGDGLLRLCFRRSGL